MRLQLEKQQTREDLRSKLKEAKEKYDMPGNYCRNKNLYDYIIYLKKALFALEITYDESVVMALTMNKRD